jgi:hypothetical protein
MMSRNIVNGATCLIRSLDGRRFASNSAINLNLLSTSSTFSINIKTIAMALLQVLFRRMSSK